MHSSGLSRTVCMRCTIRYRQECGLSSLIDLSGSSECPTPGLPSARFPVLPAPCSSRPQKRVLRDPPSVTHSDREGFRSGLGTKLVQEVVNVEIDRREADTETVRDLGVGEATCNESQNVHFAGGDRQDANSPVCTHTGRLRSGGGHVRATEVPAPGLLVTESPAPIVSARCSTSCGRRSRDPPVDRCLKRANRARRCDSAGQERPCRQVRWGRRDLRFASHRPTLLTRTYRAPIVRPLRLGHRYPICNPAGGAGWSGWFWMG